MMDRNLGPIHVVKAITKAARVDISNAIWPWVQVAGSRNVGPEFNIGGGDSSCAKGLNLGDSKISGEIVSQNGISALPASKGSVRPVDSARGVLLRSLGT